MKPKSLKIPFPWSERHPHIEDRVFYVPNYFFQHEKFTFPSWEAEELFGNSHPVHVEYCSGNGDWIVAKALENPECNWVAVEKRFDRVRKIWAKLKNNQVKNLIIVSGEGLTFTENYLPSQTLEAVYVNFPDPWPKDRHAKHRIIQAPFVKEVARILKDDGKMVLVTDDADYSLQMIDEMEKSLFFEATHPKPYYLSNVDSYGTSWFEKLWKEKGREIRHIKYRRLSSVSTTLQVVK
jgi:tRNA (guanine-N7-)-methyltransferase